MTKDIAELFGLTEISEGEYAYLNPEVEKEDFIRVVMEYEILLNKYKELEKQHASLLNNTRSSFAKMKNDIEQLKASINNGGY